MEDFVKLGAIAVSGALCALVVRRQIPELALVLVLATGVLLLTPAVSALGSVKDYLDTLADMAGLSPAVLAPLVKTVGIALVTKIASELCRDAGEGGIASFTEIAGGAAAAAVALPLMQTVLSTISVLL